MASRRAVEELIAEGRVVVNGKVAVLGDRVDPDSDRVEVDGSIVPLDATLVYYLMNKPAGVVTTAKDPEGRPTVLDLVDLPQRVWSVGRLDLQSEGALILTNDGELSNRLTHPRFEVEKTYVARVGGGVRERDLRRLASGVVLEDGETGPARVRRLDQATNETMIELTIREGRNRQVRRMFEALGYKVHGLVRTHIGSLALGRLKPGSIRRLSPAEVRALYKDAS